MESSEQYPIMEIFDSIQGEGSWLGIPATFIRFAGCNLRCEWCDTKNSWQQGSMMTVEAILDQVYKSSIIITGGKPALCELGPLIDALRAREKVKIAIETNGTNPINVELDWIVCSPKPDADYVINCEPNELKYVVDTTFTLERDSRKISGSNSDMAPTEFGGFGKFDGKVL